MTMGSIFPCLFVTNSTGHSQHRILCGF